MTKNDRLIAKFGTANIIDLLGPAGTIPPTQTIAMRLKELGISAGHVGRWIKQYIPLDLLSELEPYQKGLQASQRKATFDERFGGNPMFDPESLSKLKATNNAKYGGNSPCHSKGVLSKIAQTNLLRYNCENVMHNNDIKARHDAVIAEKFGGMSPLCDPSVVSKFKATCQERFGGNAPACSQLVLDKMAATNLSRYGGHHMSIGPDEIINRLRRQNLEPLEPITERSDKLRSLHVKCLSCGREFLTSWVAQPSKFSNLGFYVCECQTHGTNLEKFLLEYIQETYYPSAHQWSHIPWLSGKEIDIYIPELHVGIEINGYASHNSENGYKDYGEPKSPEYHRYKSATCLSHGIKLYHFWHSSDTSREREQALLFAEAILHGKLDVNPGDKVNRDIYPDPSESGLPYTELPPEPFDSPSGVCYNSGYWQF